VKTDKQGKITCLNSVPLVSIYSKFSCYNFVRHWAVQNNNYMKPKNIVELVKVHVAICPLNSLLLNNHTLSFFLEQ
jgi:hypothetical protein